MTRLLILLAALLLPACAGIEHTLSVSLPGEGQPRAYVTMSYRGQSITSTELRASDAQSLAEMVRLMHYAQIARAQAQAARQ